MTDPTLFGKVFASPSFWTWKVVAKLIDGVPLTEKREIDLYRECTGRTNLPTKPVRRLIILAGRRAGKDRFESAVAVWRAAALSINWRDHQSAGEGAVALLLGADKKQAAILRKYCAGLLEAPLLARGVKRSTGEVTEFRNGSSLEIATNDARLVRGRSAIAVLGSEFAGTSVRKSLYADANLREAISIVKEAASLMPIVVDGNVSNPDDVKSATASLQRLVEEQKARAPWMSAEQAWDAAMRARPDLSARAIPRPTY